MSIFRFAELYFKNPTGVCHLKTDVEHAEVILYATRITAPYRHLLDIIPLFRHVALTSININTQSPTRDASVSSVNFDLCRNHSGFEMRSRIDSTVNLSITVHKSLSNIIDIGLKKRAQEVYHGMCSDMCVKSKNLTT